ncbi:hypothetical protein BOTBODRAFT_101107 [Botryobasidium botryosum FD-172 SS1]|uniref:Protein kinase domain-containing protein n=1 Tax=Botryobasidium botryosum (strain FD-172 SS1) TaxID=930990 RepID=A0A067NAR5_BOTB1|nr:hypothetical protein BOTBODRAFT_101107 [Botryobasidium botryosum FD-172 SS1]
MASVALLQSSIQPFSPALSPAASPPLALSEQDPTASDIFSISDQQLSDKLEFIKEIGFGNWGSVWACRPKVGDVSETRYKVAVKLVHRSKTPTTAARVRSLWNEMKIVRTFKHESHPSIIPFHSFIITPSYALITMDYLPRLMPVEVRESKATLWFESLVSGVAFLHARGVVHNDIKPANILLSETETPVLVDFGFAEKYDSSAQSAFQSSLAYGTPEYLSPERARGHLHDTRKSDVWSLGITFFEILTGRTPFEKEEGEEFSTKEALEDYWARTVSGVWIGEWNMTPAMEHFLRRMISPDAKCRITAAEALRDSVFHPSHTRTRPIVSLVSLAEIMTKFIGTRYGDNFVRSFVGKERYLAISSSFRQITNQARTWILFIYVICQSQTCGASAAKGYVGLAA